MKAFHDDEGIFRWKAREYSEDNEKGRVIILKY